MAPSIQELVSRHKTLDIANPDCTIQIDIRSDGKVLWMSADGVTICRISGIPRLEIVDNRSQCQLLAWGKIESTQESGADREVPTGQPAL